LSVLYGQLNLAHLTRNKNEIKEETKTKLTRQSPLSPVYRLKIREGKETMEERICERDEF